MIAPIADVQDWQGLHFGIAASRPNGDNFFAERGVSAASTPDDFSGTLPTVSAGYDWQLGNLVYGVALAISSGEITANPTTSGNFFCPGCETSVEKLATLRGRLGWALGKTLIFGSAGATRADAMGTANDGTSVLGEDSVSGWTAGIGVEHFVTRKITVSAEYLHTDLGRLELPTVCVAQCYTDVSFGRLQLGLNYRF